MKSTNSSLVFARVLIIGACLLQAGCDTQSPAKEPPPPVDPCADLQFTAPVEPDAPLTGKILFSSRRTGRWQLYTMNPDGSDQRQLTFLKDHFADMGRWSPDGEQIVFISDSLGSTAGSPLYLMDADGTNIRAMKEVVFNDGETFLQPGYVPAWSPDGTRIAFTHCLNCEVGGVNQEILIYDFISDEVSNVTNTPTSDSKPTWSPDGSKISFVSDRDSRGTGEHFLELYIMDADGENQRRVTFEKAIANMPSWSPNGEWIGFALDGRLRLYHLACNFIVPINVVVPNEILPTPVAWSPDGSMLLVLSSEHGLYVVDIANEKITRLLEDDEVFFADWSML